MKPNTKRSPWMEGLLLAERLMKDSTPWQVQQYILIEMSQDEDLKQGMYDYLRNYRERGGE
jgi:hypothetical protein